MRTAAFHLTVMSLLNFCADADVTESAALFTENKGQVHDQFFMPRRDILYGGTVKGLSVFFKKDGFEYQISKVQERTTFQPIRGIKVEVPVQVNFCRIEVRWLNLSSGCKLEASKPETARYNYYLASGEEAFAVRRYSEIAYRGLYEGIDLKWYNDGGDVKYDFLIAAGKDYRQIVYEVRGAEQIRVSGNGELIISTPDGNIIEEAPVVFQSGKRLKAKWMVEGTCVRFDISDVDKKLPLVIDPAIRLWSTYFGGAAEDISFYNHIDAAGNIYISGHSSSLANIATVGSHQVTFGGNGGSFGDAFLAKYNSSGALQWCTYYGGPGNDFGASVATDLAGNVYFTGSSTATSSNVIATAGAHQTAFGGGATFGDAFLVKFDASGQRLWGTYYGGSGNDYGDGLTLDAAGNIILSGVAESSGGTTIATPGGHQSTFGGGSCDGFIAKFSPAGVRLWASYYGGSGNDYPNVLCCDASNNIYCAGYTSSQNAIASPGSHQPVYGGGPYDGFMVSFDAAGSRLWGSYYGGTGDDRVVCVIRQSNDLCFSGSTSSSSGTVIATSGAHQTVYGGGLADCFLAKFGSGGIRQWGTYYGGSGTDEFAYCSADAGGNVYLAGRTTSPSQTLIATACAYQAVNGGGAYDNFLAKFSNAGQRLWGTYYGGSGIEDSPCCACDQSNHVYLSGPTSSQGGTVIASNGSHQPAYGGGVADSYLAKFDGCIPLSPPDNTPPANLLVCQGNTSILNTTLSCGVSWYNVPSGGTVLASGSSYTTPAILTNTTFYIEESSCGTSAIRTAVQLTVLPNPSITVSTSSAVICQGTTATLTLSGAMNYSLNNVASASVTPVSPSVTTVYTITGENGNGCAVSVAFTQSVAVCSGFDQHEVHSFVKIFPNPSNGVLEVYSSKECGIMLLDMLGKELMKLHLTEGRTTLDLRILAAGAYLLRFSTGHAYRLMLTK